MKHRLFKFGLLLLLGAVVMQTSCSPPGRKEFEVAAIDLQRIATLTPAHETGMQVTNISREASERVQGLHGNPEWIEDVGWLGWVDKDLRIMFAVYVPMNARSHAPGMTEVLVDGQYIIPRPGRSFAILRMSSSGVWEVVDVAPRTDDLMPNASSDKLRHVMSLLSE